MLTAIRELGCTTLMVTHRQHTVELASQVIVLEAGHVAEIGTPDQVVGAGGAFDRLWTSEPGAADEQLTTNR